MYWPELYGHDIYGNLKVITTDEETVHNQTLTTLVLGKVNDEFC